jgi:tryptophanase
LGRASCWWSRRHILRSYRGRSAVRLIVALLLKVCYDFSLELEISEYGFFDTTKAEVEIGNVSVRNVSSLLAATV